MSHYINSFLIEPVVRQARRFSRPSDEDTSPHPTSRQLQPEDPNQTRPQVGPNIAWGSRSWRSNPERPGPHAPLTPNPDHFVLSGDFEDGSDEAVMDTRRDTEQLRVSFQHSGISLDDDATGSDRSEILSSDDRVSINPVYGVPESLRSTTSSLGESAESNSQGVLHLAGAAGRSSSDAERHYTQGREGQLPADDGMGLLRKRIVAIQRTDSSSVEKARMVHELMTEQYNSSQPNLPTFRARSPASLASHERPLTPGSIHSLGNNSVHCTSPLTSLASVAEASNPFNLAPGDLRPTFYQKPTLVHTSTGAENPSTDRLSDGSGDEAKPLGCPHYKRNIKLQCSACHRWYTCRFCHDEVEDHSLNRRETKNMLCMLCGSAQPASEHCIKCTKRSARYYCSVCKLWDDDAGKSIYHCADCGICRIGQGLGKDFYHCKVGRSYH